MRETRTRSMLKAISYRLIAYLLAVIVILILTKDIETAFTLSVLYFAGAMLLYYLHERLWNIISYGKALNLEDDIELIKKVQDKYKEYKDIAWICKMLICRLKELRRK